jgi:hypothetical protein
MSAKTRTQTLHIACISAQRATKPDFGEKSEAGKSEAILSARQHRPEGQNPIARTASRRNTAQAWLAQSMIWKSEHRFFEKIMRRLKDRATIDLA